MDKSVPWSGLQENAYTLLDDCPSIRRTQKNGWFLLEAKHDTTVYAFLSIMGIEEKVIQPIGYPAFSAGAFMELWINSTDNEPYFKLLYHKNGLEDILHPITHFIDGCIDTVYCKLEIFRKLADRTRPDEKMEEGAE
ncbi:hypothetical protein DICVIV_08527 [Dictyocaulus viviparus]|uniref:Uncharacterized protein n=1 Tax=Dictyocaulus viviparus TaxID=29172 RepID=A0A0D8XLE0_DICVI|nr:hypothetical protein DICVIV_08527 [Dictyocaulus viviparus]